MAGRGWGPYHLYRDEREVLAQFFGFDSLKEFDTFREQQEIKEIKRLTKKARR